MTRQHQSKPKSEPQSQTTDQSKVTTRSSKIDLSHATPQGILQLQRLIGNQAVVRMLQPTIQRKGAKAVKAGEDENQQWEKAVQIMEAVDAIINNHVHPERVNIPEEFRREMWTWFVIANPSGVKYENGMVVSYTGRMLYDHIIEAHHKIEPYANMLKNEGDEATKSWVNQCYYRNLVKFMERATKQEAQEKVEQEAGAHGTITAPEQAAQESQLKEAIATGLNVINEVTGTVNNVYGANKSIVEKIAKKLTEEFGPDAPIAKELNAQLKALGPMEILGEVGNILGAAKDILEIADPEKRKELYESFFGNKFGSAGRLSTALDVVSKVSGIAQGAVSAVMLVGAGIAYAAGLTQYATRFIALSQSIGGAIGKVAPYLNIAKGYFMLIDEKSSAKDKISGAGDIASGIGGIVGGSVGLGLAGSVLALKANLAIAESTLEAQAGLQQGALQSALAHAEQPTNDLAIYLNRYEAATKLALNERDQGLRQELEKNAEEQVFQMRITLNEIFSARVMSLMESPLFSQPLKKRLYTIPGFPKDDMHPNFSNILEKASPQQFADFADNVLDVFRESFVDREAFLAEAIENITEKQIGKPSKK